MEAKVIASEKDPLVIQLPEKYDHSILFLLTTKKNDLMVSDLDMDIKCFVDISKLSQELENKVRVELGLRGET